MIPPYGGMGNEMRIVVTGGGTGGHIYPAIAIADRFRQEDPETEILYIGNEIGLEKDIVPKAGFDMELIDAMWIDRSNIARIFRTVKDNMKGIRQASRIMKRFRPDAVIGTGGYVCFPVLYAGHRYGARCYIHEQNAYPGVANKSLERYASKVFLGFPEASEHFRKPDKHVVSGNPVRAGFFGVDRKESRELLGIPENHFTIFSFGGSQGAERINEVVFDLMKEINGTEGMTLIYGTGTQYYDEICEKIQTEGIDLADNIRICPYIDDMPHYLGASDLIISRAGALSVAETCVCGRASIMIPSPNVTGNHQYFNAKSVADRGGSVLIEEKDLTSERLIREIMRLKNDQMLREAMEDASLHSVPRNAAEIIYREIIMDLQKENEPQ